MELGRISIAGESNIGAGRMKNEDNYCIFNPPGFPSALAVVCDGIGGHRNGEVASMFCCRRMMAEFLHRGEELHSGAEAGAFLAETLTDVNAEIFRRNEFDGRTLPMGCTAVCAVFTATEFAFCSVGDSRIYGFAPETGSLRQLSVDDVGAGGRALSRAIGIRRIRASSCAGTGSGACPEAEEAAESGAAVRSGPGDPPRRGDPDRAIDNTLEKDD